MSGLGIPRLKAPMFDICPCTKWTALRKPSYDDSILRPAHSSLAQSPSKHRQAQERQPGLLQGHQGTVMNARCAQHPQLLTVWRKGVLLADVWNSSEGRQENTDIDKWLTLERELSVSICEREEVSLPSQHLSFTLWTHISDNLFVLS